MRFVIVTGMSGAGKSSVLKFLEDINFFCVDNLPPALIPKLAELCYEQEGEIERVAMGVDIRGGKLFNDLFNVLFILEEKGYQYEIIFLDASDNTLIKRYKETRRSHPLSRKGAIEDGILQEREMLKEVKGRATYILDTTNVLTRELKAQINRIFMENQQFESLIITVCSFGFKYGIPVDSDLVFDVRFLPNPFYIQELKEMTGNDTPVSDYVMSFQESRDFLKKLVEMVEFLLPLYVKEGKNSLVISIGCTGGKHRSVTLANALYHALDQDKHTLLLKHNDIEKDARHKKQS
ncbi:glmZ(sRNA)-inactivating NTPase [Anaerotignum neopropionicum]|uniref:GlmZ(SRNA)-inactivating NTPase n=1 Tax=Anaerotignum neopropionicum TaxID=36847 RepID=A0A136WFR2_9FIRM|nr:RNase adapter RapZ [Anaerotignum neopropionicum]KXL53297.1 glmZ(sRNA)-inactivating NTPase [Anaerotignum neopropionicum]